MWLFKAVPMVQRTTPWPLTRNIKPSHMIRQANNCTYVIRGCRAVTCWTLYRSLYIMNTHTHAHTHAHTHTPTDPGARFVAICEPSRRSEHLATADLRFVRRLQPHGYTACVYSCARAIGCVYAVIYCRCSPTAPGILTSPICTWPHVHTHPLMYGRCTRRGALHSYVLQRGVGEVVHLQ